MDAELLTLAVMQALLGYTSEARWLRKLAETMRWLTGVLGQQVSVAGDDVWVADSTPVECGRSRETAKGSDLAGWAECALTRSTTMLTE